MTDLAELNAFIAVAEHRSFRAAALVHGVSASALSHRIRGLEVKLGVRLFNRTTRSVALTDAGATLLRRVQPAMVDIEGVMQELSADAGKPTGHVRISAAEIAARILIREVLPSFAQDFPGINVEFVVDTRMVDIVADGFDAGVRLEGDVPRDMIAVRLGPEMRFAAIASAAYLKTQGAPLLPLDLMSHRCIRYRFTSGALFHWRFEKGGEVVTVDVQGPLTLGNTNLMIEAALEGLGIAWVPDRHVQEHLTSGKLQRVLTDWSPSLGAPCLYYPANRHSPPAVRLFIKAVRDWSANAPA